MNLRLQLAKNGKVHITKIKKCLIFITKIFVFNIGFYKIEMMGLPLNVPLQKPGMVNSLQRKVGNGKFLL